MNAFKLKIYQLLFIERRVLMVFYTPAQGYQFRILTEDGSVYGTQEIYSTFEAAMKVARQSLTSGLV